MDDHHRRQTGATLPPHALDHPGTPTSDYAVQELGQHQQMVLERLGKAPQIPIRTAEGAANKRSNARHRSPHRHCKQRCHPYKEARASIEAAGWQQSMDEEMTNLRKLGCWTVIPRSSLPPNTPIMGTRWTYRKKTDENGTFTRYRGRLVAKGFSQILGVNYFESFSPVASFVTIRTLFASTALPMFKVYQYDVQVAFIQSVIDPNHPPVYCTRRRL